MAITKVTLYDLIDKLNLDYNETGNMRCPFCKEPERRRTLHLDADTDFWRCNKCKSSGGVLHFYSKYVLGCDLPSEKDKKSEISKQLREFMGDNSAEDSYQAQKSEARVKKKREEICPAKDSYVHEVYTAMSALPVLQLTEKDKKELMRRGLSEEVIVRNGYRSIPVNPVIPDLYEEMYVKAGGDKLKNELFSWHNSRHLILGLMIAHSLVSAGYELTGVPGFFMFGDKWCFWFLNPGILIPTRNIHGQIVIWQARQAKAPKYLTLHCRSLPGAINTEISRCHFPIGNAPLSPDVPVIYTEGPLKADIACQLYGSPCSFFAIPGIEVTKDLLKNFAIIKKAYGITEVFNGFDMDRLTNPNVRRGSRKLMEEILNMGLIYKDLTWGTRYAETKLLALGMIAKLRKVPVPTPNIHCSVFDQLDMVAEALDQAGINPCKVQISKNKDVSFYWESSTKGIDDYLFTKTFGE